jgi:RNA polymerase sigma-70 factor, ECF subfamily
LRVILRGQYRFSSPANENSSVQVMRASCPSTWTKANTMECYHHPTCDPRSRVSRNINIRAARLARSGAVPGMDADDIGQELRLHLLSRDSKFDPARGGYDTFADRVLANHVTSLAAPTERLGAERKWVGFDAPAKGGSGEEDHTLSDTLPESAAFHATPRARDESIGLVLDVRRLLAVLNPACHAVAVALADLSPTDAARALGIHRSTVYVYLAMIRKAAIDLGLHNYLGRPRQFRASAGM